MLPIELKQIVIPLYEEYQIKVIEKKEDLWFRYINGDTDVSVSSIKPTFFNDKGRGQDKLEWEYVLYKGEIQKALKDTIYTWNSIEGYRFLPDEYHRHFKRLETQYIKKMNDQLHQKRVEWFNAIENPDYSIDELKNNILPPIVQDAQEIRVRLENLGEDPIDAAESDDWTKKQKTDLINKLNNQIKELQNKWWAAKYSNLFPSEREQFQAQCHAEAEFLRGKVLYLGGTPPVADTPDKEKPPAEYQALEDTLNKSKELIDPYEVDTTIEPRKRKPIEAAYRSFSGCDALAYVSLPGTNPILMGQITTISYNILRNKKPVLTCGRISVKGFVKGPRIIAGTLIFTALNESWVEDLAREAPDLLGDFNTLLADELPPFDINIIYASEYGNAAKLGIYGVTIVEEGQVSSIEDNLSENVCKFVARELTPMETWTKETGISKRSKLKPSVYDNLPKFKTEDLVLDDTYEKYKKEKQNVINNIQSNMKSYDGEITPGNKDYKWIQVEPADSSGNISSVMINNNSDKTNTIIPDTKIVTDKTTKEQGYVAILSRHLLYYDITFKFTSSPTPQSVGGGILPPSPNDPFLPYQVTHIRIRYTYRNKRCMNNYGKKTEKINPSTWEYPYDGYIWVPVTHSDIISKNGGSNAYTDFWTVKATGSTGIKSIPFIDQEIGKTDTSDKIYIEFSARYTKKIMDPNPPHVESPVQIIKQYTLQNTNIKGMKFEDYKVGGQLIYSFTKKDMNVNFKSEAMKKIMF